MAKTKSVFVCQNCGNESAKWVGKCSACGEWNTYVEEVVLTGKSKNPTSFFSDSPQKPQKLTEIELRPEVRMNSGNSELDRVLGGGVVPGSLVLVGGDPGIGKSTLVLQVSLTLKNKTILYVSGEESLQQLKMRAQRVGKDDSECLFLSETSIEKILHHAQQTSPDLLIIDSIQTMVTERVESSPGSVGQVRECAGLILKYAKASQTPVILIGHINKEGSLAGPKVLEHMVDTVLQFEGDKNYMYRILRAIKNRFGSTSELGIFEMQQNGLREVLNPSELLLSSEHEGLSGVCIAAALEGMRPFLIEVQALVSTAVYGTPQRSSTGFDLRRMNMLLAVLEKRMGFKLGTRDVFLNIAGGIKVNDPGIDLAVLSAVLSSSVDKAANAKTAITGEVGLSGEVRSVSRIDQRIAEAEKLGFESIIIPKSNLKSVTFKTKTIRVIPVQQVKEAFQILFQD